MLLGCRLQVVVLTYRIHELLPWLAFLRNIRHAWSTPVVGMYFRKVCVRLSGHSFKKTFLSIEFLTKLSSLYHCFIIIINFLRTLAHKNRARYMFILACPAKIVLLRFVSKTLRDIERFLGTKVVHYFDSNWFYFYIVMSSFRWTERVESSCFHLRTFFFLAFMLFQELFWNWPQIFLKRTSDCLFTSIKKRFSSLSENSRTLDWNKLLRREIQIDF